MLRPRRSRNPRKVKSPKYQAMKPSEKLIQRLKADLGLVLSPKARIVSIRPGAHQKSAGAWSWMLLDDVTYFGNLGSAYTVADCLKSTKLEMWASSCDIHIESDYLTNALCKCGHYRPDHKAEGCWVACCSCKSFNEPIRTMKHK